MDEASMAKVMIPAAAAGSAGGRILAAGAASLVVGVNAGAMLAGSSTLRINDRVKIPMVCCGCGTKDHTESKILTKEIQFSSVGAALGGGLVGNTKAQLQIPVCAKCGTLPGSPVHLDGYAKVGDAWRIDLLFSNVAIAELCADLNREALKSQPELKGEVRLELPKMFSGGRRHKAQAVRVGGKWAVVVDDGQAKLYDAILRNSVAFSPDDRCVVYAAGSAGKWQVIVNWVEAKAAVEGKAYDNLLNLDPPIAFSPDGRRMAYGALSGGKWTVVVDGAEGKLHDAIVDKSVAFSRDGRRLVYGARDGDKWVVVLDGSEGPAHQGVADVTLSPDGGRIAYAAKIGEKWAVVLDGVPGQAHDAILGKSITFSPDGSRLAHGAGDGAKWSVILDGAPGPSHDALMQGSLTFSPNGARIAYAARAGEKWTLVVDGISGPTCDAILAGSIGFSPDGRRIACVARVGTKLLAFVDGVAGRPYDAIGLRKPMIQFSPDCRRTIYAAQVLDKAGARKLAVVVDGVEGRGYDGISEDPVSFSPDGSRFAYAARAGKKWLVVVEGAEGKPVEAIKKGSIVFSPDGTQVSYGAFVHDRMMGGFKWTTVVEGVWGSR
jgi:WD40 repeat protein